MMRTTYIFPNDVKTLVRRFVFITAFRTTWLYLLSLKLEVALNGLWPNPWFIKNGIQAIASNPEGLIRSGSLPFLVNFFLTIIQLGLVFGALRLGIHRLFKKPVDHDIRAIDGGRLRRSWWSTPLAMTGAIILTCYFLVWFFLLATRPPNAAVASMPLAVAFRQTGYVPLYVGAVLGLIGTICGVRFTSNARAEIGRQFGIHYLAEDHWLTKRVHALAASLDLPPPAVGLINALNAFAAGSRVQDAVVALGVPLVNALSDDELDAVIAHELGHVVSGDMRQMQFADGYQRTFGGLFSALAAIAVRVAARHSRSSGQLAYAFGRLGRYTLAIGSELMVKGLSRSREYYADAVGAALTTPETMARALEKVHTAAVNPMPAESQYGYLMFKGSGRLGNLFSTHPTLNQRKAALESKSHIRILPEKTSSIRELPGTEGNAVP